MDYLVEKSFYLTSLFTDIKTKHNWTANEAKYSTPISQTTF